MITVGIHDSLKVSPETTIREKGGIDIYFERSSGEVNMFDAFDAEETITDDNVKILLFPINVAFKGEKREAKAIINDLLLRKFWYSDILKVYTTEENVKKALSMEVISLGLGINKDNLDSKILDETVCNSLSANLDKAFIKALNDFNVFKSPQSLRIKFVRQSADKHFPTLPKSRQFNFPWCESMDIPKEASKVVFTEYEINNDLNNPFPKKEDTATETEVNTASSLFGSNGEDTSKNDVFPDESMDEIKE